jgi:2-polyprenyl-3-methyl-5-hydroxy-6-metoxy-1,4-benzoquinol methylase
MNKKSLHDIIVEMLASKGPGKVLDAGAGTGILSKKLKNLGFRVVACDINTKQFKAESIPIKKVDLNKKFPYRSQMFDYVCAIEVIEHIKNPYQLFAEFNRILKKGGYLVLSTPNVLNVFSRLKFLHSGYFFLFDEKESGHVSPLPFWSISKMLSENGFKIKNVKASSYLQLSGRNDVRTYFKRILSHIFYFALFPLLKPKNKVLLKGDSLIIEAQKQKSIAN